jgi:hypothetical protein
MPTKETPEKLLTKYLGKETAKALLGKIDKMIAKGETAAKIEKATQEEIAKHIGLQINDAINPLIGSREFVKLQPAVTVNIQRITGPQILSFSKVSTVITVKSNVKIGPQIKVK